MAGSIEKRGENSYRLVVSGGTGSGGKRKKYSKTIKVEGKTEAARMKEAEKALAKFVAEVNGDNYIEPSKLTLTEYAKKWLEEYAKPNLEATTIYSYKHFLELRILPAMGHLQISKIKPVHIVEFLNNLREDGIREDGRAGKLSENSIKHYFAVFQSMFSTAVKWQLLSDSPADHVDAPKVVKHEADFYEEEEIQNLLAALEQSPLKYKVIILLTLSSGLREGEVMGLKWRHIDFENSIINVEQSNQYTPEDGTFTKGTKNRTSKRVLALPAPIMELLSQYEIMQKENRIKCGSKWVNKEKDNSNEFLFTQWNGLPMHPRTPSKWFAKFLKKNGLRKITFHQLRHTSASVLINAGLNVKALQKRLGHSDASTTLNIYSHALKSADRDSADKIGAALFKKPDNAESKSQA